MLTKMLNILKKPYLPPRIEFEKLEENEMEMLMVSLHSGTTPYADSGDGDGDPKKKKSNSLDLDFTLDMDFVINEEPQL